MGFSRFSFGVAVGVCALVYAYASFNNQINLSIRLKSCANDLRRHKIETGSCPSDFYCESKDGIVDYRRTREGFVLRAVGLWSDEEQDFDPTDKEQNCLRIWRDSVFTDSGAIVYCLK